MAATPVIPVREPDAKFSVAAYCFDGSLVGIDNWPYSRLSEKWLGCCIRMLEDKGESFDCPMDGHLSHIRVNFTSAAGAALVSISAKSVLAVSALLMSGVIQPADDEVARMFIEMMRHVERVNQTCSAFPAFAGVLQITERPVVVVVPWPMPELTSEDERVVQELLIHLAGAFFVRAAQ